MELVLVCDLDEARAFEREKYLENFTILEGVEMRILKGIWIISLVIKWAELWSEKICELWKMRVFKWYEILRRCSLWDMKIWRLQSLYGKNYKELKWRVSKNISNYESKIKKYRSYSIIIMATKPCEHLLNLLIYYVSKFELH